MATTGRALPRWAAQIGRFPGISFGVAMFVLMAVWSLMIPLFAGPDETSNYVKGAAVVRGILVGEDRPPSPTNSYWMTEVGIDRQFNAANWIPWCFAPDASQPACTRPLETTDPRDEVPFTAVGRYPPAAFALTGLGTAVGAIDLSVRLGRLCSAAACAALLGAAFSRLSRDGASPVVLLAAVPPGAVFLGGVISPSGVEICAAIACWVLLPRALSGELVTRADHVALAAAAFGLIAARPVGPLLFAVLACTCVIAGHTVRDAWRAIVRLPVVAGVVAAAGVGMVAWYLAVYDDHLGNSVVAGQPSVGQPEALVTAIGHLPGLVTEAVGNYGWLDTPTPTIAVWLYLALVTAVVATSISRVARPTKLALCLLGGATVLLAVLLDLQYYRLLRNFGVQGRHLTPLLAGLPLLVSRAWRPTARVERLLTLTWGVVVAAAGLFALRRYSVGVRGANVLDMFDDPAWAPPLGVAGSLLLLVVAIAAVLIVTALSQQAHGEVGRSVEASDLGRSTYDGSARKFSK